MICNAYVERLGIKDTINSHTGDGVLIATTSGKTIVLHHDAYVMTQTGMMRKVSTLVPKVSLMNVGRVRSLKIVGGRHMMYKIKHETTNVNGFICALWKRI